MKQQNTAVKCRSLLLRMLTRGCSVQEMIDAACAHTNIQVMILDDGAHLFCHSSVLRHHDPTWTRILEKNRIPYRFASECPWFLEGLWMMIRTKKPVCIPSQESDARLAFAPLLHQGLICGHVIAYAKADMHQGCLIDIITLLGRLYLHKHAPADAASQSPESFFLTAIAWELLSSDTGAHEQALQSMPVPQPEFKFLRVPALKPPFLIAAMRGFDVQLDSNALARIGGRLKAQYSNLYYLADAGTLFVLFAHAAKPGCPGQIEELLRQTLPAQNLVCGLSYSFADLRWRGQYKNQAFDAMQAGRLSEPESRLAHAGQLYPELLLWAVTKKAGGVLQRSAELELLCEYDDKNGTAYRDTLEQYLLSGCSHTKAAKALYIDRSTLKYRLMKLQSLTGYDLDSVAVCDRILMELKQIRYENCFCTGVSTLKNLRTGGPNSQ